MNANGLDGVVLIRPLRSDSEYDPTSDNVLGEGEVDKDCLRCGFDGVRVGVVGLVVGEESHAAAALDSGEGASGTDRGNGIGTDPAREGGDIDPAR